MEMDRESRDRTSSGEGPEGFSDAMNCLSVSYFKENKNKPYLRAQGVLDAERDGVPVQS